MGNLYTIRNESVYYLNYTIDGTLIGFRGYYTNNTLNSFGLIMNAPECWVGLGIVPAIGAAVAIVTAIVLGVGMAVMGVLRK